MQPRLKQLILKPLLAQRKRIVLVIISLFVLSTSQGILLMLVGPMVKALFLPSNMQAAISLSSVIQPKVLEFFPALQNIEVDRLTLCYLVPIGILVAGFLKCIATYFYQLNQQGIALFVAKCYRDELFVALLKLPYLGIRAKSAGEWMSRIMNDVLFLQTRLSDVMSSFVKDSVLIVTSFSVLLWIHWQTALTIAFISPFIAVGMGRTGKRIAYYAESFQRELARLSAIVLDMRNRFEFVRAQGGENVELARFRDSNDKYFEMIKRSILIRSAFAPGMELIGFFAFAGILYSVSQGHWQISAGVMFQFFAAIGLMLKPLRNLGEQMARFHETKGSLHASFELFESIEGHTPARAQIPAEKTAQKGPLDKEILISDIKMAFDGVPAVRAKNVTLAPRKSIAIIGPSGAGKSTLVKSLVGLLEPLSWDANETLLTLRNSSSMVSQDPFLFDDRLDHNLAYGLDNMPNASVIQEALAAVNINSEVEQMPSGIESPIRAIGNNLSGGQIQRLVIARALLRERPILILDEATSAVDAQTEQDITERLIERCGSRNLCLLSVTHRLKWLGLFDEVWFFESGELKMVGAHETLMENERYSSFYNSSVGALSNA